MKKRYDDPIGFKTCHMCSVMLHATRDNFSRRVREKDLLNVVCKKCDNKRRIERFKNKSSHNIYKTCKYCSRLFAAELCKVNKGLSIYCSVSCKSYDYHRKKKKKEFNYEQATNI
jgi:hypothetical protein